MLPRTYFVFAHLADFWLVRTFNCNPAPVSRPYQQRTFSTSTRSLAANDGEHVPRTPIAEDISAHASEVPNFAKYYTKTTEQGMKGFSYFAIGTMGLITAAGAKSLVSDFLKNMSASADVLALAKVEVDMNSIPEGKNVIIKVGLASFDCLCSSWARHVRERRSH